MEKNEKFEIESSGLLSFDPVVLVHDVLRKWHLILVLSLVVGMMTYIITDATYQPIFQSGSTMVVTTRSSNSTVYSNLDSAANLATVFTEMVNSTIFRKTVLEAAGISGFDGKITATVIPDTNLLTLRVTATDPKTAFLVAQAVLSNHKNITEHVIGDVVLEVLQKPTVPVRPSNMNNASYLMNRMVIITAVVSCIAIAYFSYLRDMVRSGHEARKKLDCWYLGEIPHEHHHKTLKAFLKRQKRGVLISDATTSFHFVETVHKIRHRVEQRLGDRKVLMVTSLLENEGKSTISVNLALAMAKRNRKVLLIDCDLRKPACALLLNVKWNQPGVRAVLTGEAKASDLIVHDKRNGLDILLERSGTPNSSLIVGSERMSQMLEQLRQEYDVIIMDLPPMATVSDAEAVMELADASMLVVRQNTATAPAVNKAVKTLNKAKSHMIGCVLNNVYSTEFFSGQGYGHEYGSYNRYRRYGRYGKYGAYSHYGSTSGHADS